MWAKYKFAPEYRTDLSFAVFFKPRLSECIRRDLNTVKYSLRRTVCKKAAEQLNKPWGKLTKEDIGKVKLTPQEMSVLEVIFSTQYDTTYEEDTHLGIKFKVTPSEFSTSQGIDDIYTEQYDALEDLIVHEMIEQESKLDDEYLLKMAQLYDIPFAELVKARPIGEQKLKYQLEEYMDIKDTFDAEIGYKDSVEIED